MQNLMERIGFSADEMDEVLGFIRQLKEKNLWGQIQGLAKEIMSVHPCGNILRRNLEKAENLDQEAGLHKYSMDLVLLLQCALWLNVDYQKANYAMDIYYDSMKDITYKMHECQDVYGVTGIFVGFWYDGFFDMTRFAMGRLQFEMINLWLGEPVTVNGYELKNGDAAINMHILSSGPLNPQEAESSLAMAKECFRDRFANQPVVFVMDSWLLDKDLMTFLPEGNIKKFVNRFQVLRVHKHDVFYDGWRVFGAEWEKSPEELPRNTRLQRAIADYLQQGGKLGEGYGVIVAV